MPEKFKPDKAKNLEDLTRLFAVRPIWSSLDLQERIGGVAFHEVELLSKHAYMFRAGRFSMTCVLECLLHPSISGMPHDPFVDAYRT